MRARRLILLSFDTLCYLFVSGMMMFVFFGRDFRVEASLHVVLLHTVLAYLFILLKSVTCLLNISSRMELMMFSA